MFYLCKIEYHPDPFNRGFSHNRIFVFDLLSQYDCVVSVREFIDCLGLNIRQWKRWNCDKLFLVYDSDINTLFLLNDDCQTIHSKYFDIVHLSKRFGKFMLRCILDNDKVLPSWRVVHFFLHDLAGGLLPSALAEKYCFMRTFGIYPLPENFDGTILTDAPI